MRILLLSIIAFTVMSCGSSAQGDKSGSRAHYPDKPVAGALRILSYNVKNGTGMDNKADYKRTAGVIKAINPDVVALQELDSVTGRSNGAYVLEELAKAAGMEHAFNASIDFDGGKYGIGILSKNKILNVQAIPLPGREEARSALFVELENCVLCCTHLSLTEEDRITSIGLITDKGREFDKPVFLAGDINDVPNSVTIELIKENWTILNDVNQFTFSSTNPHECIDYIAILDDPAFTIKQTGVIPDSITSDHRPVYVDVVF